MARRMDGMVRRMKSEQSEAWGLSQPGCARVVVSAHDTGTYVANQTDRAVAERAVFVARACTRPLVS